ncbi:Modification methylase DpnIIB [Pseudovibrio axinellae]|uniref:Methyltransferase n=1 Tax=Pseudovibrio axinellae TaxID=989403 RepID=A0A165SW64_9HYPH|nr:site-specific DNA-methyltransferase [Pseudovibrio axinellae]KZL04557.1 Modification methylase DpnIIB [Pseudovibrio axinellae]SEQ73164.1 DNA modification methylase [Pseudovibrio axinellae]
MTSPDVLSISDLPCEIRLGDVLDRLREMPDNSVDCVVTSPPYWGLRDYGVDGQLGLEPTLKEHLDKMVEVFEEVRRVLKPDGTCWINYGDCYATTPAGHKADNDGRIRTKGDDRTFTQKPFSTIQGNLKPKDLCMVPNRFAIALQDAGWWVRGEIIWAKPNPMPESVRDRPAVAHEKIWLLTKSPRYFYDKEAVRQGRVGDEDADGFRGGCYTRSKAGKRKAIGNKRVSDKQRGHSKRHAGFDTRWDQMTKEDQQANGRNLRNYEPAPLEVWNVATRPFPGAHFATFPPELAQRCIEAGCPRGGVVLDPFGGAGTTGLVALRHGRRAILIELNPAYAAIAQERIEKDWMGPAELKSHGAAADDGLGPLFSQLEPMEVCNA